MYASLVTADDREEFVCVDWEQQWVKGRILDILWYSISLHAAYRICLMLCSRWQINMLESACKIRPKPGQRPLRRIQMSISNGVVILYGQPCRLQRWDQGDRSTTSRVILSGSSYSRRRAVSCVQIVTLGIVHMRSCDQEWFKTLPSNKFLCQLWSYLKLLILFGFDTIWR